MSEFTRPSEYAPNENLGNTGMEAPDFGPGPDLTGGHYKDPDPNTVAYINKKCSDPEMNLTATLMKAYEIAGIVKSMSEIKGTVRALEKSGGLPLEDTFETKDPTLFTQKRDEQLLIELQEGNDTLNSVLTQVNEAVAIIKNYDRQQLDAVRLFGKNFLNRSHEVPPTLKILLVMIGLRDPEEPDMAMKSPAKSLTADLAPELYWLMVYRQKTFGSSSAVA